MERYQPEGGYRALAPEEPLYRRALDTIAAIRLAVEARRVKWKLGQNRSPEIRARVAARLRERGRPNDARAAAALEGTLRRGRRSR
jgi:predicted FMN-binding regulatory protein PaiB